MDTQQPIHSSYQFFLRNKIVSVILIAVFLVSIILAYYIGAKTGTSTTALSAQKTSVAEPLVTKKINKDFTFPIKNDQGKALANLSYTIESIQLQDQIILNGQKADAIKGRSFLIVNLKITNPSTQSVQLNTRDFIRLSPNNTSELFAPEIHNDPVTVQAISTKYTRVGLPVDDTIKNVHVQVGEINGQKTTFDTTLK